MDGHPNIKCGHETKILSPFINFANHWRESYKSLNDDLKNAYLNENLVDLAIIQFFTNVMLNLNSKSKRGCATDPDIVMNSEYLHKIFPSAKFIYMVRDGRAAAYSQMVSIFNLFFSTIYFISRQKLFKDTATRKYSSNKIQNIFEQLVYI